MLAGQQFHFLTALEFDHRTPKCLYWRFVCVCGNELIARTHSVEKGQTKSCGCQKSALLRSRPTTWAKPPGVAARNALMNSYRFNATKRGMIFDLTPDEFAELTSKPCFYCGVEPLQAQGNPKRNGEYLYNGIDRVDNLVGYVLTNCVPCCGICNVAKNDLTTEEFQTWIDRLISFYSQKEIISR